MKAAQIVLGHVYIAKVSGKLTEVKVKAIRNRMSDGRQVYDVENLRTGRKTVFESAAKFRSESPQPKVKADDSRTVETGNREDRRIDSNPGTTSNEVPASVGLPSVDATIQHTNGLAARLQQRSAATTAPHLIIEARAGSGKTTTLIEGLKYMKGLPTKITPSVQQQAVWDQLKLSADAQSVAFVAFNKSIATELQQRVPQGCEAMTMHSMGFKACQKQFGRLEPNQYVVQDLICDEMGMDIRDVRYKQPVALKATEELVALCKQNLVTADDQEGWSDALDKLTSHYDVDLNGSRTQVYDLVPKVLERCKTPKGKISFDDMIWLPVVLNLPVTKYDLLLVDESQDLNRCQQALAKKAGKRLVLCGDPRQAIYGFAGADSQSMNRMREELGETDQGCTVVPLTVTRRCGKAIVTEANRLVPDFEAHEDNPLGKISNLGAKSYQATVNDGEAILCRVNAPLVQQCFRFIKAGRRATIQGRDVATGLIKTVEKLSKKNNSMSIPDFVLALSDWLHAEEQKENAKRFPNETKLVTLQDRHDCLLCFTDGCTTVGQMTAKIDAMFTDDKSSAGIKLSSVHKSKGLEWRRVFYLKIKGTTFPSKSDWEREQSLNLEYVAITRAIEELIYVYDE